MAIFAGTRGYLDTVAVSDVGRFEASMLSAIKSARPELMAAISASGEISPEIEKELGEFLDGFIRTFA